MPQARTISFIDAYGAYFAAINATFNGSLPTSRVIANVARTVAGTCLERDGDADDRRSGKRDQDSGTTSTVAVVTDDYAASTSTLGTLA